EDRDRIFREVARAVGGAADDRDEAARARVRRDRAVLTLVEVRDRRIENGIGLGDVAAREGEVDVQQAQVVRRGDGEIQPVRDLLRIRRRGQNNGGRRLV